eukprot:144547_1
MALIAVSYFALFVILLHPQNGADIFIENSGFEMDPIGFNNSYTYGVKIPANWDHYDPNGIMKQWSLGIIVYRGGVAYNDPIYRDGSPEGVQLFYLDTSSLSTHVEFGIEQTLATNVIADTMYTLSAWVGNPASNTFSENSKWKVEFFNETGFGGYHVQLVANGNVLAEDDNSLSIPEGTWKQSVITTTISSNDINIGQPLQIRLIDKNIGADNDAPPYTINFDDVQLKATSQTASPSSPTNVPTLHPALTKPITNNPSLNPSVSPTKPITNNPTLNPSVPPSVSPTKPITNNPTPNPSVPASVSPTNTPELQMASTISTSVASTSMTIASTILATNVPTLHPSDPTHIPSTPAQITDKPTDTPRLQTTSTSIASTIFATFGTYATAASNSETVDVTSDMGVIGVIMLTCIPSLVCILVLALCYRKYCISKKLEAPKPPIRAISASIDNVPETCHKTQNGLTGETDANNVYNVEQIMKGSAKMTQGQKAQNVNAVVDPENCDSEGQNQNYVGLGYTVEGPQEPQEPHENNDTIVDTQNTSTKQFRLSSTNGCDI